MYQTGYDAGVHYGARAREYDPEMWDEDPQDAAMQQWTDENPHGSRDWYEMGYDKYSDEDWDQWRQGFAEGVDSILSLGDFDGLGASSSCTRIDRIEVCVHPTEVCSETQIRSSVDVYQVCQELMVCNRMQEEVWVLCVNPKSMIVAFAPVTRGSTDEAMVVPSDILRIVLASGVRNMILVHNHPSGSPEPSTQDRNLTMRMVEAARMVGFTVLDHVIVAEKGYYSFRDEGAM